MVIFKNCFSYSLRCYPQTKMKHFSLTINPKAMNRLFHKESQVYKFEVLRPAAQNDIVIDSFTPLIHVSKF